MIVYLFLHVLKSYFFDHLVLLRDELSRDYYFQWINLLIKNKIISIYSLRLQALAIEDLEFWACK